MNTTVTVSQRILSQIAAAIVATTAAAWHSGVHAEPAERISAQEGVTLKVTPKPWLPGAREWSFSVALDTHSQALDDNLSESAVLVVDGREVAPLQWSGPAPGGHHREGVLTFPAPDLQPAAVELHVQRPGEATPRVLRWDATSLK